MNTRAAISECKTNTSADIDATSPTGPDIASAAAQAQRRAAVHRAIREATLHFFDDAGTPAPGCGVDWRGRVWLSFAYFSAADGRGSRRANALLRTALPLGSGHFWLSATAALLARYRAALDADVRMALESRLREAAATEGRQTFRGYNDNYPAMAALSALVGGPLAGTEAGVAGALEALKGLKRLLSRRGMLSEYGSPTYTPITLACLADIVEWSPIEEARELARWAEGRVWLDLLARYHPATSCIAGPYSRAYTVDLCGHFHSAHTLLYQVLGDQVFINPLTSAAACEGQVEHGEGREMAWARTAWETTPTYHVPPDALEWALEKPPLRRIVRASAEQAAFPRGFWQEPIHSRTPLAEFPAGPMLSHTYLHDDFALGVSDRPFLDGYQHAGCHLLYCRRKPARRLHDIATMFPRYLIHESKPCRRRHILDEGRTLCVAHKSSALVTYWPKPQWSSPAPTPDWAEHPVSSLKLALLFTCFWGSPEEIWIGNRRAEPWRDESIEACPIFLRDGPIYIALHPLHLTSHGRRAAIRLERHNGFGMVSFINFEGPPHPFRDEELFATRNGFVLEVATAADWPDFERFRRFYAQVRLADTYAANDHMRGVQYSRPGLKLELEFSPFSDGVKFAAVNDRLVTLPRFEINGREV